MCIIAIRPVISQCIARCEENIQAILCECINALAERSLSLSSLDTTLVEVLVYERKYADREKQ